MAIDGTAFIVKRFEVKKTCFRCKGTGKIKRNGKTNKCKICKGNGIVVIDHRKTNY